MHTIRQLDTRSKIVIAFAMVFCLGALLALWQLSSLAQVGELSAAGTQKLSMADAAVLTRLRADAGVAGVAIPVALLVHLALAAALAR
jgi:hypothetical protein